MAGYMSFASDNDSGTTTDGDDDALPVADAYMEDHSRDRKGKGPVRQW